MTKTKTKTKTRTRTRTRTALLALFLSACADPPRPFALPKNVEDLRASLLVSIPEGREIDGARAWMRDHGFQCDPPMPSAADAHASVCRVAGKSWTVVLFDRNGRLADVQARP
jgi:hypothetical protein